MSPVQGPSVRSLLLALFLFLLLHFGLLGLAGGALGLLGASGGQPHPSRPSAAGDEETYLWTRTCPRLRPALKFVGTELGVSPMARPHTWLLGGWLQSCGGKLGGWCGCVPRPRAPGPCRGVEQWEER
uniref:Uncharacterized protein n=1 Tax=Theropithecus gelada TaxID=9565 RepID=A0A8D2JWY3_THEGE